MSPISERLSLSTCWNSHRHDDGGSMIEEIVALGFHQVELGHGTHMLLVPGILRAIDEGLIKVSSVHNFCPLPSSAQGAAPNLFEPSSKSRRETLLWHSYTKRTIEFAKQTGAQAVVTHSGSVAFRFRSPGSILRSGPGEINAAEREMALERLSRKSLKPMERLVNNFQSVEEAALKNGITLGVENREGVLELPLDRDFPGLLESLSAQPPFSYWHDTGHAQIKDQLNLLDHRAHLEAMAPRLSGFHLHDTDANGKDHQVPGSGTVDFAMVREFVEPHHIVVAELSPRLTSDEVKRSRDYLLDLLA